MFSRVKNLTDPTSVWLGYEAIKNPSLNHVTIYIWKSTRPFKGTCSPSVQVSFSQLWVAEISVQDWRAKLARCVENKGKRSVTPTSYRQNQAINTQLRKPFKKKRLCLGYYLISKQFDTQKAFNQPWERKGRKNYSVGKTIFQV